MRKKIGTRIMVMLVAMTIMYVITSFACGFASEQALGGMNRIHDNWTQLERLETQIVKNVESSKFYANMIVWYTNDQARTAMAQSVAPTVEATEAALAQMMAICEGLEDGDLAGTPKEDVLNAMNAYIEAVRVVQGQAAEVAELYLAGDAEAAANANNGATKNIEALTAAETVLNEIIVTTSENLVAERQASVDSFSSVSDTMFFVFLGAAALMVIIVNKSITKPAKGASGQLNEIITKIDNNEGDLTERIDVKSQDEIGQLVSGVNNFIEQLQGIMLKIRQESNNMSELVNSITAEIADSNDNASSISATMEELSASMEEVAATLDEITTGAQEILNASKEMSDEAETGKEFVTGVKGTAVSMRSDAQSSKENTTAMIQEIRAMLEVAIANSRSVEKINELTDEILNISSQTNLLALNASIEAARAGEAGKGFAVVADEIRVLAENSKNTANNIQGISSLVTNAVEELSSDANKMIEFIDSTVLADYDKFVDMANSYHNDADHMDEILQRFYGNASKLAETMAQMTEGIDGINIAVDESAQGVTMAAQSTAQLVDALVSIKSEADTNREISEELQGEVKRFKNI
ncbi:MAG: methyl-accepting chemotaxis protein [Roseburia sp.]|nr:methyl-accepting chemotaxis protein [Roseburia sp.]